jgi:hypothetical protein
VQYTNNGSFNKGLGRIARLMQIELKIDLVDIADADFFSLMRDKSERPDGLTIRGPICTSLNGVDAPTVAPYLIAVISVAGTLLADAGKDYAKERIKDWLTEFLARHKATRARINGKKTETRADVERVIREEIDISKHD